MDRTDRQFLKEQAQRESARPYDTESAEAAPKKSTVAKVMATAVSNTTSRDAHKQADFSTDELFALNTTLADTTSVLADASPIVLSPKDKL